MTQTPIQKRIGARQWRMLYIYNIYRLVSIGSLCVFIIYSTYNNVMYKDSDFYSFSLAFYVIFGFLFLHLCKTRTLKYERQVLWSGTVDIIVMVLFIHAIGYMESGLGILLIANIAMLSILVPGRLAVYFASIASCMFLATYAVYYLNTGIFDLGQVFSTGIYGAGFFATAVTAWYLASWAHSSEELARQRARELASVQKLNEYIVEKLQHGVIFVTSGEIKLINSAARMFFSCSTVDSHLTIADLSLALEKKYQNYMAQPGTPAPMQTALEKPYVQVTFFPSEYADKSAVVIIIEDLTELAQQAQQLKLASLGKFSAGIAHELRNPLGIIAHAVQLLGDEGNLGTEDSRLKQLIMNNCNRMNNVIKNVLQISRREKTQPEPLNMSTFLKQFKSQFSMINQCDIQISIPKEPIHFVFDKSQLEQILVILCDNVIEHGKNDKGEAIIHISLKKIGKQIEMSVCDEGKGIPDEISTSIFDPFFSTKRTGNGMGLFIAKDLCEINQARLRLGESKKGGCFVITLKSIKEI